MKYIKILLVCMLVLLTSACNSLTREGSSEWLEGKSGSVTVNMTGKWNAGGAWSGGWGEGNFLQEGRNISGTLGMYYVDGVVSGDNVYLVLFSGRKVYYTARLKKNGEGYYIGKAAYRVIIDKPGSEKAESYVISLKRM